MLHIILLILKIIGIVLLCIIGIILVSVFCALFVPVRYKVKLSREEGEGNPPFTAYVKITWFLHFVNILIRYPGDVILRVRLMVFTLFRIPEKRQKAVKKTKTADDEIKNKSNTAKEEANEPQRDTSQSPAADDYAAFETHYDRQEEPLRTEVEKALHDRAQETERLAETERSEEETAGKKFSLKDKIQKIIDKIRQIIEKIKALFENIQYTIRKFCDKIKSTLDNIQYYREVMESETFKRTLELCKDETCAILKSLKPDKLEAELTVGMTDPAVTGQILAIYGMLYPLIGQNVHIIGDFESDRTRLEGQIYIRGKIRAFTFLKAAIKIYFNKDIKKLIKLLKKEAV